MGLPDIDGIQTTGNIMCVNPVPIILVTSHHDAATVARAIKSGAMAYLIKPLRKCETQSRYRVGDIAISGGCFTAARKRNLEGKPGVTQSHRARQRHAHGANRPHRRTSVFAHQESQYEHLPAVSRLSRRHAGCSFPPIVYLRRYPVLHRRVRQCRRLYRLADPPALLRASGALSGARQDFRSAYRGHRPCDCQRPENPCRNHGRRLGDFFPEIR